jgi:hypothetical protein
MGISVFNNKKPFDGDTWVVTLFNSGAASSGHAALFVEGEVSGRVVLYRAEIFAASFPGYLKWFLSPTQSFNDSPQFDALYKEHAVAIDPTKNENVCYVSLKTYTAYPKDFSMTTATSWQVSKEKAEYMLEEIQREKKEIETNTRRAVQQIKYNVSPPLDKFTLFKKYGRESTVVSGTGVNCVNWCEDKLPFAGIQPTSNVSDSIAARPEDHAAQRRSGAIS